jgi:hypothetical protein
MAAASLTLARNAIVYSNPFHPHNPRHLGRPLATYDPQARPGSSPSIPDSKPRREGSYLTGLGYGSRPVAFVLSATELDWLVRGVAPRYDIDSNTGDRPRRWGPARTGGWWGPYVVALAAIVLLEAGARRATGWRATERRALALLALSAAAAAATPLAYLLRYWIHVPLLLVFLVVLLVEGRAGPRAAAALAAALGVVFLVSWLALPSDADLDPRPYHRYDAQAMRARLRPELAEAIAAGRSFCLDARHDPLHFRYSAAILGGSHRIEQVRDRRGCRVYPLLDVPPPGLLPPAGRGSPSSPATTTSPTSAPEAPARTAS